MAYNIIFNPGSGSTAPATLGDITGGSGDITRVANGLNTYTGGTDNTPSVNVSGLTIDNITVSGAASFQSLSATTIYSGSSDLSLIFAPIGGAGGNFLPLSGGTMTGTISSTTVNVLAANGGNGLIQFQAFADPNNLQITNDGAGGDYTRGWMYMDNTETSIGHEGVVSSGSAMAFFQNNLRIGIVDGSVTDTAVLYAENNSIGDAKISDTNNDAFIVFLGGRANSASTNVFNSVILGGTGLTASENNTAYMMNADVSLNLSASTIYSGSTDVSDLFATASNVGGQSEVFKQKTGANLEFRTLSAGTSITISQENNTVTINSSAGGGNVTGPGSSTDEAIARYDGTTGQLLQDSGVKIDDSNNVIGINDLTVTGATDLNTVSATTYYSGTTDLSDIFIYSGQSIGGQNDIFKQRVGTDLEFRSVSAGTSITISQEADTLTINSSAGGGNVTGPGSSTDNAVARYDGTSGQLIQDSGVKIDDTNNVFGINDLTVSGETDLQSVSATTYYSGTTDISDIFIYSGNSVGGQNNIFKQRLGTHLEFKTLSAGTNVTITEEDNAVTINSTGGAGDTTRVANGINTFTAGTENIPSVNITGASLDNLFVSGDNRSNTFSAGTVSATTIVRVGEGFSHIQITKDTVFHQGGTFTIDNTGGDIQVDGNPRPDLNNQRDLGNSGFRWRGIYGIDGHFSGILSGGTLYSGASELSTLFADGTNLGGQREVFAQKNGKNLEFRTMSAGTNITISQENNTLTFNMPTSFGNVNGAPSTDNALVRWDGLAGTQIQDSNVILDDSGNMGGIANLSATTIYSGSTDLSNIFIYSGQSLGGGDDIFKQRSGTDLEFKTLIAGSNTSFVVGANTITINSAGATGATENTRVQPGTNTYTGGTADTPTVNVSGLTIDNLTVSGATDLNTVSATTYYSGSTDLSNLFQAAGGGGGGLTSDNLFEVYQSGTSITVSSISYVDHTWDALRRKGSDFGHTLGQATVTAQTTGTYEIAYSVSFLQNTNNARASLVTRVELDTGSGFAAVPGSNCYQFAGDDDTHYGNNSKIVTLNLSSGDVIQISTAEITGTGSLDSVNNGCNLYIKRIL